jgi:DNA gyrase/topoisomerase IV subunit B
MYIGYVGNHGYLSCVREIFQNAIDEMMKADSPCYEVKLEFYEANQLAIVYDTGRGIPHGHMVRIYTSEHTSSNYTKKPGEYSSGAHGVGAKVSMALSETFDVVSYILGEGRSISFRKGHQVGNGEKSLKSIKGRQGTVVSLTPDYSVLGEVHLTPRDVYENLVLKLFPLTKVGHVIDYSGYDLNGNLVINEHLKNTDGIITNLIMKTQTPLIQPIHFQDDTGYQKAEIA